MLQLSLLAHAKSCSIKCLYLLTVLFAISGKLDKTGSSIKYCLNLTGPILSVLNKANQLNKFFCINKLLLSQIT